MNKKLEQKETGKSLKYKTIDIMKQLLDFAKNLPIILVEFDVMTNNKFIEEYIITHVERTDWEGNPLSDDEIQKTIYDAMKRFYNSKGYNKFGISTLTIRKFMTLQNITYDNIYEIVSGKCDDIPKEYKFIGKMKLAELQKH